MKLNYAQIKSLYYKDSLQIESLLIQVQENDSKPAIALSYCKNAITLVDKTNLNILKYLVNSNAAFYLRKLGELNQSIVYYKKSLSYLDKKTNSLSFADTYSEIAVAFKNLEKWDSCLYYNLNALEIRIKEKDEEGEAISYNGLALLYRKKSDYVNAKKYFNKAIFLFNKINNYEGLVQAYINYGQIYKAENNCDSAILSFQNAKAIAEKNNIKNFNNTIKSNTALCLNDLKKYNEALEIYNDLLTQDLENNADVYPWMMYGLGNTQMGLGNLYQGIEYFERALKLSYMNSNIEYIGLVNLALSICYEKLEKNKEALSYFKIYKNLSDSFYDAKKTKAVDELKTKYETKEKEQAIELLQKENQLKDLSIKEKLQNLLVSQLQNKQNQAQIQLLYKENELKDFNLKDKQKSLQVSQLKINEQQQQVVILNKESQLKDLLIQEKKRNVFYTTIGLILFGIIAFAALWLYRSKRRFSDELSKKNIIIYKSLQEKEILLKEIHHRVKNNLQVISSLLNLQSKSITDEVALSALNEGKNRVKSMALIHQNLYRDDNLTGVDIKDYIEKLVQSLFSSYNIESEKIILTTEIENLQLDVDTVIPLGLILNELINNSLKYAFLNKEKGLIEVKLHQQINKLILIVKDDGIGIEKDDLNKENTSSIGYKLVHSFLQKLNASIDVKKENGTIITLIINKYNIT